MSKIITHDNFLQMVKENNQFVEVIGIYKGMRNKIKCKCLICGQEYYAYAQDVKRGKKHRKCANKISGYERMKLHDSFISEMKEIHPEIDVIGDYTGAQEKIKCRCKIHDYEFLMTPTHLLSGKTGCKECASQKISNKLKKQEIEFLNQLSNINKDIIVLSEYISSHEPIHVKCKKCDYEWYPIAGSLLAGNGCPHCVGRNKTTDEFVKEISLINDNVEIIGEYIDSKTKIKCRCKTCNHEWYAIPGNLKYSGCPVCNLSHGEKRIAKYLKENNIEYESQKKFPDLLGVRGGNLSYDFYISDKSVLIEYQGQFHDGTAYQQSEEDFKMQIEHDKRKREYAINNNYCLIEIWYWDYNNIEQILEREIC